MMYIFTVQSGNNRSIIGALAVNSRRGHWSWTSFTSGSGPVGVHQPYRWSHNGTGFVLELVGFATLSHARWNISPAGITEPPEPWVPRGVITNGSGTVSQMAGPDLAAGSRFFWEGGVFFEAQDWDMDRSGAAN